MNIEDTENGKLETWTTEEVRDAMAQGRIVVIDVRTPQEYSFEHIPGALLAPMHGLEPRHLPGQGDKQIVFHCGSGVRSRKVAEKCLADGFGKIAHMDGGFGAWKAAGLEYTGIDMASGAPKEMRKTN